MYPVTKNLPATINNKEISSNKGKEFIKKQKKRICSKNTTMQNLASLITVNVTIIQNLLCFFMYVDKVTATFSADQPSSGIKSITKCKSTL